MKAKYDQNFERLMDQLALDTAEHIAMRTLLDSCQDRDFVEYLMSNGKHMLRNGQRAKTVFDAHYNYYKAMRAVQEAKSYLDKTYTRKSA